MKIFALENDRLGYQIPIQSSLAPFPMYIHAFISVVVSIWAIAALVRAITHSTLTKHSAIPSREEVKRKTSLQRFLEKFKGCRAIMIINITSIMMVMCTAIHIARTRTTIDPQNVSFCQISVALNLGLPTVMAATNPLIVIWFNQELRNRVKCSCWKCDSRTNQN